MVFSRNHTRTENLFSPTTEKLMKYFSKKKTKTNLLQYSRGNIYKHWTLNDTNMYLVCGSEF